MNGFEKKTRIFFVVLLLDGQPFNKLKKPMNLP
jgi:hypothetical protein